MISYSIWYESQSKVHSISSAVIEKNIKDGLLTDSIYDCDVYAKDLLCIYDDIDKYYFDLNPRFFSYRYFERPVAERREGKLWLIINNSDTHEVVNSDYMTFYINKSDFPDIDGIKLDYFKYSEINNYIVFQKKGNLIDHHTVDLYLTKDK